mmetsp:Transcript_70082/g.154511  ORF Transcript_70082/g.154511 Transcript_70082/m.154511 type:complete len:294 (+) Transcript_70082:1354-2235(+)
MDSGRSTQSSTSLKAPANSSLMAKLVSASRGQPLAVDSKSMQFRSSRSLDEFWSFWSTGTAGKAFQCRVTKFFLISWLFTADFAIAFGFGGGGPFPPLPFPFPLAAGLLGASKVSRGAWASELASLGWSLISSPWQAENVEGIAPTSLVPSPLPLLPLLALQSSATSVSSSLHRFCAAFTASTASTSTFSRISRDGPLSPLSTHAPDAPRASGAPWKVSQLPCVPREELLRASSDLESPQAPENPLSFSSCFASCETCKLLGLLGSFCGVPGKKSALTIPARLLGSLICDVLV